MTLAATVLAAGVLSRKASLSTSSTTRYPETAELVYSMVYLNT
uniref:Uncharacterized protein n=1 Tax=Anguilla anguilla TaxID=7936 RepID=A0A0E9U7D8_ANGAN